MHFCSSYVVSRPVNVNCLTHALDNVKVQYLQFMAYMKTPQYRTNLQQALEQEKVNLSLRIYILYYNNELYNYNKTYIICILLINCFRMIYIL